MDYLLLTAVLVDLIIGDPGFIPHPVIIIGKLISTMEEKLRRLAKGKYLEKIMGMVLVLLVTGVTYFLTFYFIRLFFSINYYLGVLLNIWLLAATIALKGLAGAGIGVYNYLKMGDIVSAREATGQIVGRDTEKMGEDEIIRSVIETVAENTSDGIVAPLFFYLIGGTALAMTYKAVNTLDSMIGHLNDRYRDFGWAAARLDDLANLIPARLTGLGFCAAAFLLGYDSKRAWRIMRRDAAQHPSPNAGYPEAAAAGALGIRLGGLNHYHGRASFRPYLGEPAKELAREDIKAVVKLMYWNVGIIVILFLISRYFLN